MNNLGRGNWFLMFLVLILGMVVLVMATAPSWGSSSTTNYTAVEEINSSHNLSAYVVGFSNDVTFAFDTTQTLIYWTTSSGRSASSIPGISSWINITNSSSGNLTISAKYDNQTGFFEIPIQAKNVSDSAATTEVFEFIINATNDAPTFVTSVFSHNWSGVSPSNYTVSLLDEEGHYPLNFTLTQVNCTHGALTGRLDNENCSIFTLTNTSNTSAEIGLIFDNNLVGTYWFNLTATEGNHSCPHAYCDSTIYENNLNVSQLVMFEVQSSLSVDVSNCTNQIITEDEQFNCTINVTTVGAADSINLSSIAFLRSGAAYVGSGNWYNWFYANSTNVSSNFILSVPISIIPEKNKVGNWTINFSAKDMSGIPVTAQLNLYVNFTEDLPYFGALSESSPIDVYGIKYIQINATDEDLLIQDSTVRRENLTFTTNESSNRISIRKSSENHLVQYVTANITINHTAFMEGGEGNYSILINVTDKAGNVDTEIFEIRIWNDTAPVWNDSNYTFTSYENNNTYINLSQYVSDAENDTIMFYYTNDTRFDNFNLTSSGIINFTPSDVDVGQHIVTIIAGDGKLNTSASFNFTIYNVADIPSLYDLYIEGNYTTINDTDSVVVSEDTAYSFILYIDDGDFLIPLGQKSFYNETLTVGVNATNSSGTEIPLFNFSFGEYVSPQRALYNASFSPSSSQVGNYTVFINITDVSGNSINRTFYLNITSQNDAPVLTFISNQTATINNVFYLDINATDEEDDASGTPLNYVLQNLTIGGDFLSINLTSGVINVSLNSSYAGVYLYNVSVNDSEGAVDSQVFSLIIYGAPNISSPLSSYAFNWKEGNATGNISFGVDYDVNNTVLTYLLYLDKIVYYNSTSFNYTDLINASSLRNQTSFLWVEGSNFTWNFTPNYSDETYGKLKNLTLIVYNPSYPELNDSVNWAVNVSHTDAPVRVSGVGIGKSQADYNSNIEINLSQHFLDEDVDDPYYSQNISVSVSGDSRVGAYANGWILTLSNIPKIAFTTYLIVTVNDSSTNVSIANVEVEFTTPSVTVVSTPSSGGGGGGSTKLKYFSLRLIVPEDIIISDKNYIDIPFGVENNGQMDLVGINLSSFVRFNNEFSDDVKISLGDSYIPKLEFGQTEKFTMRILANTQKEGRYKATILANVTSPKFNDWGDFFIEIRKTNQSEAEQILVFTEKLIAENPECLELTEQLKEAESMYASGEYSNFMARAQEVIESCEDAIEANDQIKYPISGFVRDNFYYVSFATLVIFLIGFVFYVYKRVRFNKSKMDEYV